MNEATRLGDVARFVRGITFKPADVVPPETPGAIPCMRTKNVQSEIDLSDVWFIDSRFVKRDEQRLEVGDLLVSSANSWNLVGKCCWVPESVKGATFGGFIAALRPHNSSIDARYLYHWFSSSRTQATVRSFGRQTTNISNLDFARCLDMKIPLPGMMEQRRIAQVLDQMEALRAKRRQTIALLDDLTQSTFLDMFGSPASNPFEFRKSTLGALSDVQGGLQLSGKRTQLPIEIPYLRVANVYRNRLQLQDVKKIHASAAEVERTELKRGDLLLVEGHGNPGEIGRAAIWDGSISPCTHQNHLIRVRLDKNTLLPEFVAHYINSPAGRRHLLSAANTTSGLNTISVSVVKRTPIAVPDLALQTRFVERVEQLDSLKSQHLSHLAELDALFTSLQLRAFRGDLWRDDSAPAA